MVYNDGLMPRLCRVMALSGHKLRNLIPELMYLETIGAKGWLADMGHRHPGHRGCLWPNIPYPSNDGRQPLKYPSMVQWLASGFTLAIGILFMPMGRPSNMVERRQNTTET